MTRTELKRCTIVERRWRNEVSRGSPDNGFKFGEEWWSGGLDRCILYCILFVFMLVLYCFCVATEFSVNKDLYNITNSTDDQPRSGSSEQMRSVGQGSLKQSAALLAAPEISWRHANSSQMCALQVDFTHKIGCQGNVPWEIENLTPERSLPSLQIWWRSVQ